MATKRKSDGTPEDARPEKKRMTFADWAELVVAKLEPAVREELKDKDPEHLGLYYNSDGDFKIFDDADEKSKEEARNAIESKGHTMTGTSAKQVLELDVQLGSTADEAKRRIEEVEVWRQVWINPRFWKAGRDQWIAVDPMKPREFKLLDESPAYQSPQLEGFYYSTSVGNLRSTGPGCFFVRCGSIKWGNTIAKFC